MSLRDALCHAAMAVAPSVLNKGLAHSQHSISDAVSAGVHHFQTEILWAAYGFLIHNHFQKKVQSEQDAGHMLCLSGWHLEVPGKVCRFSRFTCIVRANMNVVAGKATGPLLASAQLVILSEIVAGSKLQCRCSRC